MSSNGPRAGEDFSSLFAFLPIGAYRSLPDGRMLVVGGYDNKRTSIFDPAGASLGAFTLTQPLDAVLIDDNRVFHGVTAIEPVDPDKPAYRDVLVVTFRKSI